jgi:eukaryotic-like serine/threonine-protein kinase
MALSIDELCDRLSHLKLLSADDARSVVSAVPETDRPTDGESLATLLVQSGKLTAFQAKRICAGKAETLILGNYVLLDRIGQGGMGDVFKAEHRRMKRVVALKVVKPEILDSAGALKRFQREVETVAKLDHPNVVTAHDADEANGIHFLVMQFVDGKDLSSVVKSKGPFPVAYALDCVLQAARGLAYAHEQGIVHRDVKPGNMLLDGKGTVKVLDLGLATLTARDAHANESLTGSEMIVGTLDYMAPEQAQSAKLADGRSDIYSLGMTLWFLLTGRAAYEADTIISKLLAHQQEPIPSLSQARKDASPQLDGLFRQMVAKKPEDRPQSMQQVVAGLEAFQLGKDIAPALSPAGNIDVTGEWARSGSAGMVRQAASATSVANAVIAPAVSSEQTASIVKPHEDTTANTKKPPSLPSVRPSTKRPVSHSTKRQYGIVAACVVTGIVGTIGVSLLISNHGSSGSARTQPPGGQSLANLPSISSPPPRDYALEFDGANSHINLPTLSYDGSHSLTIEAVIVPFHAAKRSILLTNKYLTLAFPSGLEPDATCGAFAAADATGSRNVCTLQPITIHQPLHVAAVIKDDALRLFMDGKLQSSNHLRGKPSPLQSTFFLGAGRRTDDAQLQNAFSGVVDELRISKVARYLDNFTPLSRLESDKDTLALFHFDEGKGDVLVDSSGNGHHGDIYNAQWVPGLATIQHGDDSVSVPKGMPSSRPKGGFALEFIGKEAHVDLPTLRFNGSHPITLEAVIVPYQIQRTAAVIGDWEGDTGLGLGFPVGTVNSWNEKKSFGWFAVSDSPDYVTVFTREPLRSHAQIHVAGVLDNTTTTLFLNGIRQESAARRPARYKPGKRPFVIGAGHALGFQNVTIPFSGVIDEVRMSNIARYAANFTPVSRFESDENTIALYHFDEGRGDILNDASGKSHHGKIANAKWVPGITEGPPSPPPPPSAGGFALEFSTNDSYVDLPTLSYDGTYPITLEATVYAYESNSRLPLIGDRGSQAGMSLCAQAGLQNLNVGGARALHSVFTVASEGQMPLFRNAYSTEPFPVRQLVHLAGVRNGDMITLFVNGKSQGPLPLKGAYKPGQRPFQISVHPSLAPAGEHSFCGIIDEVRVSRVARYATDFTPLTRFERDSETLALYHFDEGQGDLLTDSSGNDHHGKIVNAKWVPGIAAGPTTLNSP